MAIENFKPLILWLNHNPHWGSFFAFCISFLESIAVIGLFVPGIVIMSVFGILIGSQVLPFMQIAFWSVLGSILGDFLSYGAGYHYREHIREFWPFRLIPQLFKKGETFFASHGGKSVFIGRFIGLRPLLPLIAGTMGMPILRFIIIDIIAALLWAPIYLAPGIVLGMASLTLPPEAAKRIVFFLILTLIFTWLLFWLMKNIFILLFRVINHFFMWIWTRSSLTSPLYRLLRIPSNPQDHRQIILLFLGLMGSLLFLVLCNYLLTNGSFNPLNIWIYHCMRASFNVTLQKIFVAISLLGAPLVLGGLWLVIAIWSLWQRNWNFLKHWIFLALATIAITVTLKFLVLSPRPPGLNVSLPDYSFPSSSTFFAIVIWGFISITLTHNITYLRSSLWSICILICMLLSLAYLYLGVQWFTDLLGSWILGVTLLLFTTISYRRKNPQKFSVLSLLKVTLPALCLLWLGAFFHSYHSGIHGLKPFHQVTVLDLQNWWQKGINEQPLLRTNSLERPVQQINVQWMGDIKTIEHILKNNGWFKNLKGPLMNTIGFLGAKDKSQVLPLFRVTFEDKHPVLVLAKRIAPNKPLLILQLWPSGVYIQNKNMPIYVGTLFYHRKPLQKFLKSWDPSQPLPSPIQELSKSLPSSTQQKIISYPQRPALNQEEDIDWEGQVLLLQTAKDSVDT